jgi:hypothetical protein
MFKYVIASLFLLASSAFAEISVSGKGEVSVMPDNGMINFTVNTEGKDSSTATVANIKNITKCLDLLKTKFDIDKNCINTTNFSVYPYYQDTERKTLKHFVATNSIEISVKDLSKLSDLLTSLAAINVGNIDRVHFKLSEELTNTNLDKARKLAFANAEAKAKIYAESAKMKISKVKSDFKQRI